MWDERTGGGPRALLALALLVLTLGLLPPESLLRARAQPGLIHLPAGEFEHLTQASTGQTTGALAHPQRPLSRSSLEKDSALLLVHESTVSVIVHRPRVNLEHTLRDRDTGAAP
eukprot:scaffold3405_cov222-Prasinococcus_capsulatus_cf.AAC.5